MILFFDTSALVKLFSNEEGSEKVKTLITDYSNDVYVSELALIELNSAVCRKFRNKEIPKNKLKEVQKAIEKQLELFTIVPLGPNVVEEAISLIKEFGIEHGLRTLDAMHVASWKFVAESNWQFVSSDINQLAVVDKMSYNIIKI